MGMRLAWGLDGGRVDITGESLSPTIDCLFQQWLVKLTSPIHHPSVLEYAADQGEDEWALKLFSGKRIKCKMHLLLNSICKMSLHSSSSPRCYHELLPGRNARPLTRRVFECTLLPVSGNAGNQIPWSTCTRFQVRDIIGAPAVMWLPCPSCGYSYALSYLAFLGEFYAETWIHISRIKLWRSSKEFQ